MSKPQPQKKERSESLPSEDSKSLQHEKLEQQHSTGNPRKRHRNFSLQEVRLLQSQLVFSPWTVIDLA
jgi:hypothetical protein